MEAAPTRRSPAGFVGRGADVARLHELLASGERLVTVSGPAGIGKTSLATRYLEVHGAELVEDTARGEGGGFFCDLSEARSVADVRAQVGSALGVPPGEESVTRALVSRGPVLLVLDNFEQVVEHASSTVGAWLEAAPEASFLVTSRERLRLPGEVVHELEPLSTPGGEGDEAAESEAVQLWVERLRRLRPGYTLSEDEAPLVARIVRELDGIPLAIELAAARSNVLGPRSLLERLEKRFEVLRRGSRDAPSRQATLRGALDWSWDLLDDRERAALAQCSVFRGGFTPEAAEAVLGLPAEADPLETLHSLREKSLVRAWNPEEAPGELRLGLYVFIRDYASDKLQGTGGTGAAERRHADFYVALAEDLAGRVDGHGGIEALRRLGLERENLMAVIERSLSGTPALPDAVERALRVLVAMDPLAWSEGKNQLAFFEKGLAAADRTGIIDPRLRSLALQTRGRMRARAGQMEASLADLEAAERLSREAGDAAQRGRALRSTAWLMLQLGRTDEALDVATRALDLSREAGDRALEGMAQQTLAMVEGERGGQDDARHRYEEALAIHREVGNERYQGSTLTELALLHLETGEAADARAYLERALDKNREVGNSYLEGFLLGALGALAHSTGDVKSAMERQRQALAASRRMGDRRFEALSLAYLALCIYELGDAAEARLHLLEALPVLRDVGEKRYGGLFEAYLGAMEAARGHTDDAEGHLDEAEQSLARAGDPLRLGVARLLRAALDHAEARRVEEKHATRAGELREAARRRIDEAAGARGDADALANRSVDARIALRIVERILKSSPEREDATGSTGALRIQKDGEWFHPPGGERVSCKRRHAMRRMLLALVAHQSEHPGESLSADELLDAGWPGERILPEAAKNRLHVTLSRMRDLGLRRWLQATDRGWRLDPDLPVREKA